MTILNRDLELVKKKYQPTWFDKYQFLKSLSETLISRYSDTLKPLGLSLRTEQPGVHLLDMFAQLPRGVNHVFDVFAIRFIIIIILDMEIYRNVLEKEEICHK